MKNIGTEASYEVIKTGDIVIFKDQVDYRGYVRSIWKAGDIPVAKVSFFHPANFKDDIPLKDLILVGSQPISPVQRDFLINLALRKGSEDFEWLQRINEIS